MSGRRKVTVVVTGNPKSLVDLVRSLALDGAEFSFKAWECKAKFPSYAQANAFASRLQAYYPDLHHEVK